MAGLVPAIHVFDCSCKKDVDARDIGFPADFVGGVFVAGMTGQTLRSSV
jgi:hypothetical protein